MRKKFTTTIDEKVLRDIKIQAIKENLPVSEFIEKMFKEYAAGLDDSPKPDNSRSARNYDKFKA